MINVDARNELYLKSMEEYYLCLKFGLSYY